jgi:hypothetical protein
LNYNLYHTAGHKGQAKTGGTKSLGRQPRGRRKKREPGRGHYDKDRPAIIAWVSRQGGVVIQATRDFTVKTVQKAADLAMQAGSKLYTDSASSYRLITGYEHDSVNHTKKEYARGDVHENRAECLFSLLKSFYVAAVVKPLFASFFSCILWGGVPSSRAVWRLGLTRSSALLMSLHPCEFRHGPYHLTCSHG